MDKMEKRFLWLLGLSVAGGVLAIVLFSPRMPPPAEGKLRLTITGERQAKVEYAFSCPEGFAANSTAALTALEAAVKEGSVSTALLLHDAAAVLVWQTPEGLVSTTAVPDISSVFLLPEADLTGAPPVTLALERPPELDRGAVLVSGVLQVEITAMGVPIRSQSGEFSDLLTEGQYRTIAAATAAGAVLSPQGKGGVASVEVQSAE